MRMHEGMKQLKTAHWVSIDNAHEECRAVRVVSAFPDRKAG